MSISNRLPEKIKAKNLKLADIVRLNGQPFSDMIVKKATEETVTFFRPYGVTADFSYTGGVICYTGVEEFTVDRDNPSEFELIGSKELK